MTRFISSCKYSCMTFGEGGWERCERERERVRVGIVHTPLPSSFMRFLSRNITSRAEAYIFGTPAWTGLTYTARTTFNNEQSQLSL